MNLRVMLSFIMLIRIYVGKLYNRTAPLFSIIAYVIRAPHDTSQPSRSCIYPIGPDRQQRSQMHPTSSASRRFRVPRTVTITPRPRSPLPAPRSPDPAPQPV